MKQSEEESPQTFDKDGMQDMGVLEGIKLVDEKPEKPNQIGIPEPKEIIETVPFGTTRIYPKSWLAPMSSLRTLKGNIKRLEKFINYEI